MMEFIIFFLSFEEIRKKESRTHLISYKKERIANN